MHGTQAHFPRVLVAHGEPLLALGLVASLRARGFDAHIVDIVANPFAFWDGSYEVALLDYGTVFQLLGEGRRMGPAFPKVLVLAATHGVAWVKAGAQVGVTGFLASSCKEEELLDAVLALERGQRYVCSPAAEQLAESMFRSQLTARQTEVLGLLAQGHSNKAIAGLLNLSIATVKSHVKEVLHRLQFDNRSKAVSYALRHGLAQRLDGDAEGWAEEMPDAFPPVASARRRGLSLVPPSGQMDVRGDSRPTQGASGAFRVGGDVSLVSGSTSTSPV